MTRILAIVTCLLMCGTPCLARVVKQKPVIGYLSSRLAYCEQLSERDLPLLNDTMIFVQPNGETNEIPVVLKQMDYKCTATPPAGSDFKPNWTTRNFSCYELQSKEPKIAFSWSMWTARQRGRFNVLRVGDRDTYLCWAESFSVYFLRIDKPNSRASELDAMLLQRVTGASESVAVPAPIAVPMRQLVPETAHWGRNAFYTDVDVTALSKDEDGNWVVEIANPERTKTYTVVSDKSLEIGWRVLK